MRFSPAGKGRRLGAAATSPIKINEETYQPIIVASCEIAKESRSNMCASRATFARTAITRAMPLTARSLFIVHVMSEQQTDSPAARIPFGISNICALGLCRGTIHYNPPIHDQGTNIKRCRQRPKGTRYQRKERRGEPPPSVLLSVETREIEQARLTMVQDDPLLLLPHFWSRILRVFSRLRALQS